MMGPVALLLLCHFGCSFYNTLDKCHILKCCTFYINSVLNIKKFILTFILYFSGTLQVPPLCTNKTAQLPKGEIWMLGFDDCSHFTAEQNVTTHVDLPL